MRERQFRGSAGKYSLPNDKAYILISFQKNRWNTKDDLEFTINVSVIAKTEWMQAKQKYSFLGEAPTGNEHYPLDMWSRRLAMLQPGSGDKWWAVNNQDDLESVSSDIIDRIDRDALLAIEQQMALLTQ